MQPWGKSEQDVTTKALLANRTRQIHSVELSLLQVEACNAKPFSIFARAVIQNNEKCVI